MRKVYNFSAGPAMLPEEVLQLAQAEMLDWHGTGIDMYLLSDQDRKQSVIAQIVVIMSGW